MAIVPHIADGNREEVMGKIKKAIAEGGSENAEKLKQEHNIDASGSPIIVSSKVAAEVANEKAAEVANEKAAEVANEKAAEAETGEAKAPNEKQSNKSSKSKEK